MEKSIDVGRDRNNHRKMIVEKAKADIEILKVSGINYFDEIKAYAEKNKLDICRGSYTSLDVLELIIMVDYAFREKPVSKTKN